MAAAHMAASAASAATAFGQGVIGDARAAHCKRGGENQSFMQNEFSHHDYLSID